MGGFPSCSKPPGDVWGEGPSPPACPGPVGALPPAAPRGKSQSSAQPASARKYLVRRGETGGEPRRVCRRTDGAFSAEGLCARRAPSHRTCGARLARPGPARRGRSGDPRSPAPSGARTRPGSARGGGRRGLPGSARHDSTRAAGAAPAAAPGRRPARCGVGAWLCPAPGPAARTEQLRVAAVCPQRGTSPGAYPG